MANKNIIDELVLESFRNVNGTTILDAALLIFLKTAFLIFLILLRFGSFRPTEAHKSYYIVEINL